MSKKLDKAFLLRDVMSELGWEGDVSNFVNRVLQIEQGLVSEDEVIFLLGWYENTKFFHKLDQSVVAGIHKDQYVVPDFFIEIELNGQSQKYVVEVKTSKATKLSWRESYYDGLVNYAKLIGAQPLVAWKQATFDLWTVFDLSRFQKGSKNYKIEYTEAMKHNLLGKVFGDYMVVPYSEFGMHLKYRKPPGWDNSEMPENVEFVDGYFTGEGGKKVKKVNKGIIALHLATTTNDSVTIDGDFIIQSFNSSSDGVFAQIIPLRLARIFTGGDTNWMKLTNEGEYYIDYRELYDDIAESIDTGLVRNVFHYVPSA